MKRIATILALIIAASTVHALEVELGSIKFKNSMIPNLQEYLATQAQFRTVKIPVEVNVTNELGVVENQSRTSISVREEIPETDTARLRRLCRNGGIPAFKQGYTAYFDDKARAAIPATEDPEDTE